MTLVVLMPLLTMTTGAKQLALGLTRLGLPYRAAYVITSTLNLIPSFEEEARLIIEARRLRGMESVKLGEYPALVLPLMVKAMRKAQLAGLAMDARAFGAYKTRTWPHKIQFSVIDYMAFTAGIGCFVIAVTADVFVK
jgi:energy-coupling factor transport system permease protein